jgi:CheY-like chemotaxis protein
MTKTILIIDDDEMLCKLSSMFLQREGHQVLQAFDGPSGVEMFEKHKPDLVVLDIAMPGMSGFDVAKRIRAIESQEARPHTPIILLTAYARSFFLSAGAEVGVDSYLTKPVTPEQLRDHVNRFLVDKPEL